MPDLDFKILGVEAANYGIVPLLHFKLEITNQPADQVIQSVMLQSQIQLQPTQRAYQAAEKEKLGELFGTPDRWGQTLRARLWTHATANVRQFTEKTETILSVPCTYDLNVSATKYFYALEGGEVPLLFLFSGTIFYQGPDERLQIQQVSWNKECAYRMLVSTWQKMMDEHYPNTAWLSLDRGLFERLYAFRRREGLADWEQTIERLLPEPNELAEEVATAPAAVHS
ncbi:MAG: hypothetical protein H0X40_09525 [Chthoniobacterales bacterium]|nr:hypothetical protein [Chthoniobacterales bacterium]